MTLAHVITAPGSHPVLLWLGSAVGVAGALLLLAGRVRRDVGGALLALGGVAVVVVMVTEPALPAPPRETISLSVAAAPGGSPVPVRVCARPADGGNSAVPAADQLVELFVDGAGAPAAESGSPALLVPLTAGLHTLRAEVVRVTTSSLPRHLFPTRSRCVSIHRLSRGYPTPAPGRPERCGGCP